MSHVFLKEILQEYDGIRREETRALSLRRQEVLDNIPDIGEIHENIIELAAQNSREMILNPHHNPASLIDDLQDKMAELKAIESMLLEGHGYPKDYLEMRYKCAKCQDTGYVGQPIKEKCSCLIQKLMEKTYRLSHVQSLETENFDTFDSSVFPEIPLENSKLNQREYMMELKRRLMDYVTVFPDNDRKSILFTGKTGLGKTFLLNSMAKFIMDKGYSVLCISAYKLFDQLFFEAISDNSNNLTLRRNLFEVDALIIDDLGTETRRNNYTSEDLFNIINERSLKRVHTFLSTNLGLSDFRQRYSDRIASRLFDNSNTMLIRFQGNDIRLK